MKLRLLNTAHGLVPMYDADFDEKKKLKLGVAYLADIKVERNPLFHQKYFALINAAWECLPERQRHGFRTRELFRKYVEVAAGHCETFFSPQRGEWVEIPKSIAFDKVDDAEFEDIYLRVRNVIDKLLSPFLTKEQFENILLNF